VALGAGWAEIARVIFTESAILGLIGGVTGVALAYLSLPPLLALGGADLPDIMTITIDRTVLLVALGTSVFATLMFACIPVLHFAMPRFQAMDALRGRARSITDGHEGNRSRHVLLVAQVALALVLLVGSGLMIRTFVTLRQVNPGFRNPAHVQTFQLTIPTTLVPHAERAGVHDPERTIRMQQEILDRLAAVAGVQAAGFSSSNDGLPLDGDGRTSAMFVEGRPAVDGVTSLKEIQSVSPQFFETLQTPMIMGRTFDWSDVYQSRRVVLISENLARAEWGSATAALGQRIGTNGTGPWSEVAGVVQDVHHNGLNQPAPETVIFPASARNTVASFVIRSERVGTTGFLNDLRRAVWSVNQNLSLASVQTLDDLYQRSMARTSLTLQLLAITGAMALTLGFVGIYGVVSYTVSQRRREIGIRLALGAEQGEVRRMFVRHALVLVGIGVAIGLGAAMGLTRLMESQLFGVSRLDPPAYAAVSAVLMAAAMVASYIPAHRAARVDPLVALRYE
jgi:predicted permease